ncbi:MAG TPA: ATP-binding protein [Longimicrobiaceae bacterium]|nr:ATP-binding protein [Longimicrobiaceae bacterium]
MHSDPATAPLPHPASPGPGEPPDGILDWVRRLADEAPLGVLVLDAAGIVRYVNAAEILSSERSEAETIGRDFFRDLAPTLEGEGLGEHYRSRVATEGVEMEADLLLPMSQGNRVVRVVIRSVRWGGEPWGVLLVEDRSELVREQERRRQAERLASVGELAAGVAHEVNNPLASIKSFAQLLARDAVGSAQREALGIIIEESTRISGIVGELLSFARQQGAGGREPVNLSALAERVLSIQRYALETAGIEVRRDFDTSLSPVMGEAGALHQVILNLVVNAEQALVSRPGPRLLIVRTRESSEGVVLSVVDNGPGIPRARLKHIFDPYHTTKEAGTGLGLVISAGIVRDHGGQIWAESDEGRGTAFFVQLPPQGAMPAKRPRPQRQVPETETKRRLRVLVADDEPNLRLAVSLFLSRRGHEVVQAADAYQAIRLAGEQEFDVALVDARMPGDGLDLLERLEALPSLQGRTALMTGDIGRARTSQGITTGRPCLTKPFDLDEMARLVEKLGA